MITCIFNSRRLDLSKFDTHELVAKIKEAALEFNGVPKRDEFVQRYGRAWRTAVEQSFGSWSAALQAAGLKPEKPRKIDNSIFERSIERHLEEYKPKPYTPPRYNVSWVAISDVHWPFQSQRVIDKFLAYLEETKPDYVILNGDAWDMYSHSKFPRSHNIFTPKEERELCLKANRAFWQEVKKRSPESKCYQLLGNHDVRPLKRVLEEYPAGEEYVLEAFRRDFTFEDVTTLFDAREELYLNEETIAFHGYRSQLGAHRDYTLMNCINGHTHKGGAVFKQLRHTVLFECNSGFAGDPEAKGLTYTQQKITDATPGFSAGDKWGPRFIPA